MKNKAKTKEQLLNELVELRQRIAELDTAETQRKRAEELLRESEEKYRLLIENSDAAIMALDKNGVHLLLNSLAAKNLGGRPEDFVGKSIYDLFPKDVADMSMERFNTIFKSGVGSTFEDMIKMPSGNRWFSSNIQPIKDLAGNILGVQIISHDITERRKAEEQIKASLKEKEVLLREIHHRVKNNLQVVSSLLKLQSQYIRGKQNIEMLKESQNRVKSMSLIHEKLYQSKDLAKIDFKGYIKSLVSSLFRSYGGTLGKVVIKIEAEDVLLGVDSAISCGLIINELVSNSLKHAFPDGKEGEIKIGLHSSNEKEIELIVSDDGVGIPEDLDFRKTESLGLHLVTILAEDQLHGEIKLDRNKGTEFQIKMRGVK